ncbi:MAG: 3-hydroxyanthranilate 3,4-dioxygenase [Proteobacteria bacterium]|nr:3-hydroxyanthranilate 3,4-dioxygenase [Pseudomonadota bacterium]MDA1325259.1 3-hydroxyanthranilate 3,4-dioxygenase [Pseudomonadota bacterium]
MTGLASFNLMQWIDDNRALLKPPMLNKPIWRDSDFTVIVLAGPIVRNDYHINPSEEFFYQLQGNMFVKIVEQGAIRDVPVDEGSVMLMPAGVPHSPQRPEPGSIGLVVECKRPEGAHDEFAWYCETCVTPVHRGELLLKNFATDRPRLFDHYYGTVAHGACPTCGEPNPKKIGA